MARSVPQVLSAILEPVCVQVASQCAMAPALMSLTTRRTAEVVAKSVPRVTPVRVETVSALRIALRLVALPMVHAPAIPLCALMASNASMESVSALRIALRLVVLPMVHAPAIPLCALMASNASVESVSALILALRLVALPMVHAPAIPLCALMASNASMESVSALRIALRLVVLPMVHAPAIPRCALMASNASMEPAVCLSFLCFCSTLSFLSLYHSFRSRFVSLI